MQHPAIEAIYGAATHSLIDQMDFLVQREAGLEPASWGISPADVGDQAIQMIVPLPGSVEAKAAYEKLNLELMFRKAIQRTTEAMSHVGRTEEDCPELWKVARVYAGRSDS